MMKTEFSGFLTGGRLLGTLLCAAGLAVSPALAQDSNSSMAFFTAMPAGILPGSPLAQVVKLAKAGVDEPLIQAYITNSTSTFNLDSDKLIYLKDAGVPSDLVNQMMQRDTVLQSQMASVTAPPSTPGYPAPTAPAVPVPPPAAATDPNGQPVPPPIAPDPSQSADAGGPPATPVGFNDFYTALTPYGNWVVVDGFGRCWQPGVATYNPAWEPYGDHGHWAWTDSGWYWVSDYAWGWAPFHYGRWLRDPHLGWCWSPDTVWGPSWVIWRLSDDYCGWAPLLLHPGPHSPGQGCLSDDYCGWAPLPPGAYYQDGVGYLYDGTAVAGDYDFGLSPDCFIFVSVVNFYDPHPYRNRLQPNLAAQAYHRTKPVNGLGHDSHGFVNRGIDPAKVSLAAHIPISAVALQASPAGGPRVLPSEAAARKSFAMYPNRTSSGYIRTAGGTTYVAPSAPRYNYPAPAPTPVQRQYVPQNPARQEPIPQPAPVPEPRRPEYTPPPAPERREAPEPAPSRPPNQQNQPH